MAKPESNESTPKHVQTNLKSFPHHNINPFVENLFIDKRRKIVMTAKPKDKAILDQTTGQIEDGMFIGVRKEVDTEQFTKIFVGHIGTLFDLSKVGQQVFKYVISIMDFSDEIIFDLDACKEFTGYKSKVSVLSGLTELLEKSIVARGPMHNIFYINPAVCYKGDRLVLLTEYRRKVSQKLKKAENQISLFDEQ